MDIFTGRAASPRLSGNGRCRRRRRSGEAGFWSRMTIIMRVANLPAQYLIIGLSFKHIEDLPGVEAGECDSTKKRWYR
jgi:hypothetical protein